MLPGPLVSVYQQYKQDTDSVASWLASTAKACGYPADLLSSKSWDPTQPKPKSARVKGKARKAATKDTPGNTKPSKYVVAIADFLPLANHVAQSRKPLIQVPDVFSTTINRLIDVRSGFGKRLSEHGADPEPDKDEKHAFFVGVLEAVRDVLRPHMSVSAAEVASTSTTTSAADDGKGGKVPNRFTPLSVYEPSQAFLDAPAIERPKPDTKDVVLYEAEPQTSKEDLLFALSILMDELNKIRARIKWIWSNHRGGMLDLAASAVATNTAVEFGRGLIDELTPLFKTFEGGTWALMNTFYFMQCMLNGLDINDVIEYDKEEYFNYPIDDTYEIADRCCFVAYRLLISWPAVIRPESVPLYKEGTFGVYDPYSNREAKNGRQKFEEDQCLIMEFFTELMTVVRLVPDYPVEDEFIRAMKEIDKTLEIPFYAVFAAQVFLDIHHTMRGAIHTSFAYMVTQASIMSNDLGQHIEFHKNLKIDHWPASNDFLLAEKQKQIKWIGGDPVFKAKCRVYAQIPGHDIAPESQHRILIYSPVLSGLILFRLRAEMHDWGITVANAWGSITYSAHLYNALQKENLLTRNWADMDIALSFLGDSNIWVGEGGKSRPSTPQGYYSRFCMQMGVSAAAFANRTKQQQKINHHSRAGPRGIKEGLAAVSSVFANRYCNPGSGTVDWTPEHVDSILAHSAYEMKGSLEDWTFTMEQINDPVELREKRRKAKAKAKTGAKSRSGSDNQARISPTELIKPLALSLNAEVFEVGFPYLVLHRSSWRLLRAVKDACDPLMRQIHTPAYIGKESQLPFLIGYIFMELESPGGPKGSRPLQIAADAVNRFLDPESGAESESGKIAIKIAKEMGFEIEVREGTDSEGSNEESDGYQDGEDQYVVA